MSSATATALETNELLELIFRHVSPAPWDELEDPTGDRPTWHHAMEGPRRDLYRLALCCRAFRQPALRCLWVGMNTLVPLMRLLPDLVVIEREYYFHGTIQSDSRFCHYANYIRLLDICVQEGPEELGPSFTPQVFAVICKQLQGEESMLKSLNKLYICVPSDPEISNYKELSALPAILSPSIDAITLTGNGLADPLFMKHYLPLIVQGAKFLKYLRVADTQSGGPFGKSVIDALLKLPNLRTLELDMETTIDAHPKNLLDVTRALPELTNLKLKVHFSEHCTDGGPWVSDRDCIAQLPHLKNLKSISLHTKLTERQGICGCLPIYLLREAEHLTVSRWTAENDVLSEVECYEALAQSLSRYAPGLKTLRIEAMSGYEAYMDSQSIDLLIRTIPLSELDIYDMIALYGDQGLEPIFNTAFATSANASNLKTLRLPAASSSRHLSVTDLVKVARYAVNLEHLSLCFMPGTQEGVIRNALDVEKERREPSRSALRTLGIAEDYRLIRFRAVDAIECNDLAELLDLLFPALETILRYDIERAMPIDWLSIDHVRRLHQANRRQGQSK
ncbi:hypothetical protein NMY22_g295 [Coprinellus aureogranulatus]|nr:hypothetical protein NMY22_g295 [Coprinellus aureogranulatus]